MAVYDADSHVRRAGCAVCTEGRRVKFRQRLCAAGRDHTGAFSALFFYAFFTCAGDIVIARPALHTLEATDMAAGARHARVPG